MHGSAVISKVVRDEWLFLTQMFASIIKSLPLLLVKRKMDTNKTTRQTDDPNLVAAKEITI